MNITELSNKTGREGLEYLAEADIEELMADEELDENDLINMVNEKKIFVIMIQMKKSLHQLRS